MRLDREALYSLIIQPAALHTASLTPGDHVIDAFCGAGGSSIGFARAGKLVTAIELDPERLAMAKYNAELFGVAEKISFIHGDALELLPTLEPSTLFLSPPWGGPEYTKRPLFTLECFQPDGRDLMKLALQCAESIVMQLPKNFDFNELKQFDRDVLVSMDRYGGALLSYTAVITKPQT